MTDSVFYQLPAVMPVPHRPEGNVHMPESLEEEALQRWASEINDAVEDLLRWSKEMHSSIYDNYIPQTDRIENMIMVDENLSNRPPANGSRRFFYHRPTRKLYLDVRSGDDNYWEIVFSEEALSVLLDTTNFDKILSDADSDLQIAMETLDDHIHAAEEITVDSSGFSAVLGISDSDVQHALETIDQLSHEDIQDIGTNTHDDIDSHISDSSIHFTDVFVHHDGSVELTGDWDAGPFTITALGMIMGDYAGGDYVHITEHGVYFFGEATQWDDLLGAAVSLNPGATGPTWTNFLGNTKAWHFANNLNQGMHGSFQFSHSYEVGTDIEFHIHWAPTTTNTGSVVWELEYTWQSIDGTFPSTTVVTVTDPADGTAYKHQIADFATISGSGKGMSSIMMVRVRRVGTDGADTYTGDAALLYADIHYRKNSLGSDDEYVKGP